MNFKKLISTAAAMAMLLVLPGLSAQAAPRPGSTTYTQVSWTGNGTTVTEGVRYAANNLCSATFSTDHTEDYALFVLASSKTISSTPYLHLGPDDTESRPLVKGSSTKTGSTWKYIYNPTEAVDIQAIYDLGVYVTWVGGISTLPTLTLSHACVTQTEPDPTPAGGSGLFLDGAVNSDLTNQCADPLVFVSPTCAADITAAMAAVDTDSDGLTDVWGADLFNYWQKQASAVFDRATFNPANITAVKLKHDDGSLIANMNWWIDSNYATSADNGLWVFSDDIVIAPSGLITTYTIGGTPINYSDDVDPAATGSDYIEVTYSGLTYRFNLTLDPTPPTAPAN